jgi:ATP-dependent Clp protease protease subunit
MTTQDLLKKYQENCEIKSFADVIEQSSGLNRELLIEDVGEDLASGIELIIRFWNHVDKDTPVEQRPPIKLFINSPGGSLTSCLTIIDSIKMSKTPIYTIAIGETYSAGFFIFLAGHKRFCYPNASFLFHEGATSPGYMDANKFQNFATFYKKQIGVLREITISNTNITEEWYKEHQNDDYWMFADEAIALGIADEIIGEFI